jgi:isochorismate hydrolase
LPAIREPYLTAATIGRQTESLQADVIAVTGIRQRELLSLSRAGLLVTDMQGYFTDPSSHAFIPSAPAIIPNILGLIRLFRDSGRPVFYTRHLNTPGDAGSMGRWWKELISADSKLSAIISDFDPEPDRVVLKNQYDAFYRTELEQTLKYHDIEFIVVCGVMTNLCCETTARSAFMRGFHPVIPVDATAAYNREFHLAAFRNLCFGFMPLVATADIITTTLS